MSTRQQISFDVQRATAQLWTILIDGKPRYNGERFRPAAIRERIRVLRQSCEVTLSAEAAALVARIDADELRGAARREKRARGKQ